MTIKRGGIIEFCDNYFDMLPNSECEVKIKKDKNQTLEGFKKALKIQTLVDSY